MSIDALEICVLGVGHLAAAVRTQLPLFGLLPAADCAVVHAARRVVLACSDCECASSFADANRRACLDRTPILFAWIAGERVGLGPLVVPLESPCFECQAARRWDLSLNDHTTVECDSVSRTPRRPTLNPDTRLKSSAHFGALLIARERVRLRLDASSARLVGHVAEFDPPCTHPRIVTLARAPDCPVCGSVPGRVRSGIPASHGGAPTMVFRGAKPRFSVISPPGPPEDPWAGPMA
jgi:bacteriocin biosynthesis cyclodehydratase domain-containing protein